MSDLLLACLTCIQAPEKLDPQHSVHPQTTAQKTAPPQKSVRLASSALASHPLPEAPTRSVSPDWSHRSTSDTAVPLFLQTGSQSQEVVRLQRQLRQLGYSVGPLDGLFGSQTRSAVVAFQQSQGLAVDGIAGPKTLAALNQQTASQTTAQFTPKQAPSADTIPPSNADQAADQVPEDPEAIVSTDSFRKPDNEEIPTPQKAEQSNFIAFAPFRSLSILGWIVLGAGGWLIIIGRPLRDQKRYEPEPLKATPLQSPQADATETAAPTPPPIASLTPPPLYPSTPPPTKAADTELPIPGEEETVMIFAQGEQNNPYRYALLDDANGLFVMRGNELRLKLQRLIDADAIEKTVTLLRTDLQGQSIEQSFSFQFQKAS